ncbi:HET-domain-containing protein [Xylariaceae sp. FL1019]|nr:HET-domain-containing protein [Xylariaceae sp. FL1019]
MSFEYKSLEDPTTSIRLLTLFAGVGDELLRGKISHATLVAPPGDKSEPKPKKLKDIRNTLPAGWVAHETLDERIIFWNMRNGSTSWTHPDPDVSPLQYDLRPAMQDASPNAPYEALSYAWGSPDRTKVISLYNEGMSRKLDIPNNLFVALRHLRYSDEERTLWVDAICIDQENAPERSKQVQRIGEIFSLAAKVIIWLGPSFEDSDLALAVVHDLGEKAIAIQGKWLFRRPGDADNEVFQQVADRLLEVKPRDINPLRKLYAYAYFARLWVMQEVHAGYRTAVVQCGKTEMPWALFRSGTLDLDRGLDISTWRDVFSKRRNAQRLCTSVREFTTIDVLRLYSRRACSDDCDRVYGLLNLLPPAISRHIQVDYENTNPQAVYTDLFLLCLKQEQRLSQLPHGWRNDNALSPETQRSAWPTWLPNWRYHSMSWALANLGFCSSSFSAAQVAYHDSGCLTVTGTKLATVSEAGSKFAGGFVCTDLANRLNERNLCRLKETRYPTGETVLDAYLRSCMADRFADRFPGMLAKGYVTYQSFRDTIIELASMDEQEMTDSAFEASVSSQVRTTADFMVNGILFTLSNNYIGMSYAPVSQGDEVFVVLGCDVPMILRPFPHGKSYQVVGACYVHGMMYGEALLGNLQHPWVVQVTAEEDGQWRCYFKNMETDLLTLEDPRLADTPVSDEWEQIEFAWTTADPVYTKKFRHKISGEEINSDPRLSPKALKERGIRLETITLV